MKQEYGDTVKTTRTSKIYTYIFSAHKLLGLKPGTPLTDEQKAKAIDLANIQMVAPVDSMVFDASGARDENDAWVATGNVRTERKCPFTIKGIDSVMNKNGIKADITLIKADSMVWSSKIKYHKSVFITNIKMNINY